jgi:phosphoglycerate kinase
MRRIDDLEVAGQRVLLRADLNVPLDGERITDDGRIQASLPVISKLAGRGARVIICAHLGRPKGDGYAARAAGGPSLRPVAARLGELLGQEAGATAAGLADGEVALLENVRFEPAETSQDDAERAELAGRLAGLATLYVGDGFGALHRKHASVYDVPGLLPHAAGELVLAEIAVLRQLTTDPARPYVVVLGGAKVSDKVGVIERFLDLADQILIGGAMCFSFFKAQGKEIGDSLFDDESVEAAREALAKAEASDCELVLPVDLVLGREFSADTERKEVEGTEVPEGWMGLDVGPKTGALYAEAVGKAGTVLWNGPMGAFEMGPFAGGTRAVAEAVAGASGKTVVGGGDSVAAMVEFGLSDQVDWLSTGGGASLELLEGKKLPGVEALIDAKEPVAEEEES